MLNVYHIIAVVTILTMCHGEPQTRTRGLGSRFRFCVKPVLPFLPCAYYLYVIRIPYPSLWSYRQNRSLENSSESQGRAATTIAHRFRRCICSKLKYGACNKYVRVQAWTRACEQSVYVVCAPGWFIKWVVIVMAPCYWHPYRTSTRTGATISAYLPYLL